MLRLQMDYRETVWWRKLCQTDRYFEGGIPTDRTVGAVLASHLVLTLWRELGYLARAGGLPGRLTHEEADSFLRELARDGVATGDILRALTEAKLLFAQADEKGQVTGYDCPVFAAASAAMTHQQASSRGGQGRGYSYAVKRAAAQAEQVSLLIDPGVLVDDTGATLPPETIRRMQDFIVKLDSALGMQPRPAYAYLPTTVANALPILRAYTDDQLHEVCRAIYQQREHPLLRGQATDKLLPRFVEVAAACGALRTV